MNSKPWKQMFIFTRQTRKLFLNGATNVIVTIFHSLLIEEIKIYSLDLSPKANLSPLILLNMEASTCEHNVVDFIELSYKITPMSPGTSRVFVIPSNRSGNRVDSTLGITKQENLLYAELKALSLSMRIKGNKFE